MSKHIVYNYTCIVNFRCLILKTIKIRFSSTLPLIFFMNNIKNIIYATNLKKQSYFFSINCHLLWYVISWKKWQLSKSENLHISSITQLKKENKQKHLSPLPRMSKRKKNVTVPNYVWIKIWASHVTASFIDSAETKFDGNFSERPKFYYKRGNNYKWRSGWSDHWPQEYWK